MNKLQKTLAVQAATMVLCLLYVSNANGEIRTITATGEYRMGDNDTRTDAKRLALLDAKRLALEQAGTYIESITEVKNFDLTKEEIRAYTAGIVEVIERATRSTMEGETTVVRVDVTAKIETGVVARQIDTLRKNETAKKELARVQAESDQLRQKVAAMARELATLQSKAEVEAARQPLRQTLAKLEADELVARAWRQLGRENIAAARRLLEQAQALDPSSASLRLMMGVILMQEHHYEAAVHEFRAALCLQPEDFSAHWNLARALEGTGDWAGAVAAYRTVVRLRLSFPWDHLDLARALEGTGDWAGAIAAYRTALRFKPDLAGAHFSLGRALQKTGRAKEAAKEFREVLRLAPDPDDPLRLNKDARAALRELER